MAVTRSVSPTIYVGKPRLLELGEGIDYEKLDPALAAEAKEATEITILGGFYSVDPLIKLCTQVPRRARKHCRIRIVVGLDATASIPRTWSDMRRLRDRLLEEKFVDPLVAIVDSKPVHFHTKLFRFLHRTRPVWFIGSANPGSGRHELMVRFAGRHDALTGYINAVLAKAADVGGARPPDRITSLRDFFMAGVLCHKPLPTRLFTFDAFRIEPAHRDLLSAALAGSSGVSHASPETNGFGFSLTSAIPGPAINGLPGVGKSDRNSLTPYSVDTVFGRWMPNAYAGVTRRRIQCGDAARARKLADMGGVLQGADGQAAVRSAFNEHIESMERFLSTHGIEARPVANCMQRFDSFLTSRTRGLTNAQTIERYARSVTLTPMPDLWADGSAVEDFTESFFDDVAFRSIAKSKPAVIRSILDWLDDDTLSTSEEFETAMARALPKEPWTDDDWR